MKNLLSQGILPALFVLSMVGCGSDSATGVSGTSGVLTTAGVGTGLAGAGSGPSPVTMGTSTNYRILAQSNITNVPTSSVTGNIGLSPATGAGIGITCTEVTGTIQDVDGTGPACVVASPGTLTTAISDKNTAYTDAASRSPDYTELGAGNIGGRNLGPATYKWSSAVIIPEDLTLTGGPNDIWIFQVAQGLSISSGVNIILAGGALPANIYWQVFSATLNTGTTFKGTILSHTSIIVKTGATVNGKLLAGTAVTLQKNTIAP